MSTATRERPILFSGAMVRAILAGTKTQTRRVMRDPPPSLDPIIKDGVVIDWEGYRVRCPYGVSGDRLWVRETWQKSGLGWGNDLPVGKLHYRATDSGEWKMYWGKWRPSIHMPRWASRITLVITGVRAERVQEISGRDALAEGVGEPVRTGLVYGHATDAWNQRAFAALWDSINGAMPGRAWDDNPWVWVVEFRRLPADAGGEGL